VTARDSGLLLCSGVQALVLLGTLSASFPSLKLLLAKRP
jgi:hypothetical protein